MSDVGGGVEDCAALRAEAAEFIVAVCGGAVGAVERFFRCLRSNADAAFVVLQSGEQRGQNLLEVLRSLRSYPVLAAQDGIALAAGHVYVCQPDTRCA